MLKFNIKKYSFEMLFLWIRILSFKSNEKSSLLTSNFDLMFFRCLMVTLPPTKLMFKENPGTVSLFWETTVAFTVSIFFLLLRIQGFLKKHKKNLLSILKMSNEGCVFP